MVIADHGVMLARAFEAAPSALLLVNPARQIVLVNRRAETLFDYPRAELIGSSIDRLVPPHVRDHHEANVERFFERPAARAMGAGRDLSAVRRDGAEVRVEIGLEPIETDEGQFVMISVVDITERVRMQDWFERIVEAAPNAKVIVDERGTIQIVNRAAETLFGYTRAELIGQPIDLLVPESLRARHAGYLRGYVGDARVRAMGAGRDLHGRRKDGSEVPVEIGLAPVESPRGMSTLASIFDVSEREQREAELRRSNAELEQFAYVASHDLQEPLRMVANYTELLAERYRGQLDERADKYIHYAVDGARRMQQLVTDLLAYSRVGSQGSPMVPVDSAAVLDLVLEDLREPIERTGAILVRGPLPIVLADDGQLGQLFQNLVGNALKFHGDQPPRVEISAVRETDHWTFTVADNGIGLDPKYADRVFQMFQRLHPVGTYAGSGIGLAIAKRIVERHGGRIWITQPALGGTCLHFTLRPSAVAAP